MQKNVAAFSCYCLMFAFLLIVYKRLLHKANVAPNVSIFQGVTFAFSAHFFHEDICIHCQHEYDKCGKVGRIFMLELHVLKT